MPTSIFLRDVKEADIPIFYQHQCEIGASQMADFPKRSQEDFIKHWNTKIIGNSATITKAILQKDAIVGHVVSWTQEDRLLVGYWIGKEFWRRGIATSALAQFLDCQTRRPIHALVSEHNIGSVRVLEKCGFKIKERKAFYSEYLCREAEEYLMVLT